MTIETGPPDESYDDNVEFLIDSLPEYMENDTTSGNWKLFSPIGDQCDNLEDDLQSVDRAASVQEADTIEQLDQYAKFVNLSHNEGETIEHYRARIFARHQLNSSEGTIGDILTTLSKILFVDAKRVTYTELDATATDRVTFPQSAMTDLELERSEVKNILNDLTAAGHKLNARLKGTLVYVTPETYMNTTNWSKYDGYDGVDSNGDAKEDVDAGTYAGILR